MLRVLHLLPKSADYQTQTAVDQLCQQSGDGINHEVITLGWGGTYSTPMAAVLGLRRCGNKADLIHAWGMSALGVATIGSKQKIIYSPTEFPRRTSVQRLRWAMDYRDIGVVCPTATMRRAFIENGVPIERCKTVRPGVRLGRIEKARNSAFREALGFTDEDRVFLAIGESTRAADHQRTAWAAVVLHVLDRRNRLLLWGRGPLAEKTSRFVHRLQQPDLCSIATERSGDSVGFERLLKAADVALLTASGAVGTLPIAMCMAAELPIVGLRTSTASEFLVNGRNALILEDASPRALARRCLDLQEDANLRAALCAQARVDADEHFSESRFIREFETVYQEARSRTYSRNSLQCAASCSDTSPMP